MLLLSQIVYSQSGTAPEPFIEAVISNPGSDAPGITLTIQGTKALIVEGIKYRALQKDSVDQAEIIQVQQSQINLMVAKHRQDSVFMADLIDVTAGLKADNTVLRVENDLLQQKVGFIPTLKKVGIGIPVGFAVAVILLVI